MAWSPSVGAGFIPRAFQSTKCCAIVVRGLKSAPTGASKAASLLKPVAGPGRASIGSALARVTGRHGCQLTEAALAGRVEPLFYKPERDGNGRREVEIAAAHGFHERLGRKPTRLGQPPVTEADLAMPGARAERAAAY